MYVEKFNLQLYEHPVIVKNNVNMQALNWRWFLQVWLPFPFLLKQFRLRICNFFSSVISTWRLFLFNEDCSVWAYHIHTLKLIASCSINNIQTTPKHLSRKVAAIWANFACFVNSDFLRGWKSILVCSSDRFYPPMSQPFQFLK